MNDKDLDNIKYFTKKVNTEKAIEILNKIFNTDIDPEKGYVYIDMVNNYIGYAIPHIIALLKTQQEMVTNFSSEVEEQQKNLDQIDLWAMEIQGLIKKIRGKI